MSDSPVSAAPTAAPSAPAAGTDAANAPAAPSAPAAVAPKAKAPTYRKFKVGDQEVSLSDEDIARDYGKWKGADAKFREAAEARKSVDSFMKALQEDPESVLSDPRLSIDRKKLAEKWLVKQLEGELNPPDPRDAKLSEAQQKLKEYEEKEAAAAKSESDKAEAAEADKRKTAIGETLHKAMQATHLSAHPESAAGVLREMAMYMRAATERGETVTPEEIVQHIHNSRFHQMYTLAHQYEGDQLIEFLGDEIVARIRKADLARLRAGREQGQSHKADTGAAPREPRTGRFAPRMDAFAAREHVKKVLG